MKRHKNLTLRKPENKSVFGATAFSKTNVMEFFDNYERELKSWKLGQAVSGKRGTMIFVCMIINSVGNTVPPVFIFLRARLHDSLMFGAPPGSLWLVNSPQSS
jgi:hypothetical protein